MYAINTQIWNIIKMKLYRYKEKYWTEISAIMEMLYISSVHFGSH